MRNCITVAVYFQERLIMGAMIQKGPFKLHPRAKKYLISTNDWNKLSDEEKSERVLLFSKGRHAT